MTRRDHKPAKTQDARASAEPQSLGDLFRGAEWKAIQEVERRQRADGRLFGDLLGDAEWRARQDLEGHQQTDELEQASLSAETRRARWAADEARWIEKLRPWAEKEKGCPIEELLQQQPYVMLVGLARLADADPAEVIQRFERGDVPAKVVRALLAVGKRMPGPRGSRVKAERWRVVHELQARGYSGSALDAAIIAVAGRSVTVDHYRRCAARYDGDKAEALRMVSDAIEKASTYPPSSRQRGA